MPRRKDGYRHREVYKGVKIDIYSVDKKLLVEKVRQRKNEIDAGLSPQSSAPTVETWGKQWLEIYKKPHISIKNYKNQESICRLYIFPAIGRMRISDVTNINLQNLINKQADKSKSHVSHMRSILTDMFDKAVLNRLIPNNPAKGLQLPDALKEGSHRALTDEERRAFLKVAEEHYFGTFLLVMYYCGLRPSEVAALHKEDYDPINRTLHVRSAIAPGTRNEVGTKTAAGHRFVPVPMPLAEKLDKIVSELPDKKSYLFHDLKGRVVNQDRFERYFKYFRRLMDIEMGATVKNNQVIESKFTEPFTSYCLRHNYCTDLLRAGVSLSKVKYLMGHNDTRMVDRIYGHITSDQIISAKKVIDKIYGFNSSSKKYKFKRVPRQSINGNPDGNQLTKGQNC